MNKEYSIKFIMVKTVFILVVLSLNIFGQSSSPTKSVDEKPTSKNKAENSKTTLGEVRTKLIGQKVIVLDSNPTTYGSSKWDYSVFENYVYKQRPLSTQNGKIVWNHLDNSYLNKQAEIIAIQFEGSPLYQREKTNALGEKVSDESIDSFLAWVSIVVRFDDGTLAISKTSLSSLSAKFNGVKILILVEEKKQREKSITDQLSTLINKTVYAVEYSKLHNIEASLKSLTNQSDIKYDKPKLQPLKITQAKYNLVNDIIILKLQDTKGSEYLAASNFDENNSFQNYTFFEKVILSFPANLKDESILKFLTKAEIIAIQQTKVFKGMSKLALNFSIGFPKKTNKWGDAGIQLVYSNGKLIVYLDKNDKVYDWQTFE